MFVLAASDAIEAVSYWPLGILAICVIFIVVSIVKFRVHPFLALILSAFLAGLLSKNLPDATTENIGVFKARTDMHIFVFASTEDGKLEVQYGDRVLPPESIPETIQGIKKKYGKKAFLALHIVSKNASIESEEVKAVIAEAEQAVNKKGEFEPIPFAIRHKNKTGSGNKLLNTVTWSLRGFGETAGGLCFIIALAAIIGTCMMGSGAADRIVRGMLNVFGEQRSGIVLLLSGFILSIPVFFDTVFFLLIPLARALSLRTGKSYTLYVIAMAGAGAITHSMVPPTPGPLLIAKNLDIEVGIAMMAGLCASILPALLVLAMAKRFDNKLNIPMREAPGTSAKDLQSVADKKDSDLPSLLLSALPVALPVILISAVSILKMAAKNPAEGSLYLTDGYKSFFHYLEFFGNPNVAMLIAATIAILTYAQQIIRQDSNPNEKLSAKLGEKLSAPLQTAGVIILITGAGGAFGGMIRLAGVGETIEGLANSYSISYILLAWLATAVVRIAQGSATVAMITGVGLMSAVIGDGSMLDYHPLYIFLAIGFGSITLSWMNDSGFWIVQRLSGFTEKETLKTWSVLLTAIAVLGLVQTLVFSKILPLKAKSDETKEQAALVVHN